MKTFERPAERQEEKQEDRPEEEDSEQEREKQEAKTTAAQVGAGRSQADLEELQAELAVMQRQKAATLHLFGFTVAQLHQRVKALDRRKHSERKRVRRLLAILSKQT